MKIKQNESSFKNFLPEVDYQALMSQMLDQSHPRRKLKDMQNKGLLIRLKKGFYVLTPEAINRDYSIQIVANLLYGPSYISLEYALSQYQLIPEKVVAITSVTTQKNKIFQTQIGRFSYEHLSSKLYPLGVSQRKTEDNRYYLMATPEKALMDIFCLRYDRSQKPKAKEIDSALVDDLRMDLSAFRKNQNRDLLVEMKSFYKNRHWNRMLIDYLLE